MTVISEVVLMTKLPDDAEPRNREKMKLVMLNSANETTELTGEEAWSTWWSGTTENHFLEARQFNPSASVKLNLEFYDQYKRAAWGWQVVRFNLPPVNVSLFMKDTLDEAGLTRIASEYDYVDEDEDTDEDAWFEGNPDRDFDQEAFDSETD